MGVGVGVISGGGVQGDALPTCVTVVWDVTTFLPQNDAPENTGDSLITHDTEAWTRLGKTEAVGPAIMGNGAL